MNEDHQGYEKKKITVPYLLFEQLCKLSNPIIHLSLALKMRKMVSNGVLIIIIIP